MDSSFFITGLNTCVMRRQNVRKYTEFLLSAGYRQVMSHQDADLIIIWSCSFRADVRDLSLGVICELAESYPDKQVIVTGCMPDIYPDVLNDLPYSNIVVSPWKQEETTFKKILNTELQFSNKIYVEEQITDDLATHRKNFPDSNIMFCDQFIKAVISGTVARETTESNRARGYAVFYMMVNIGAFTGKTVVDPLRKAMGDSGLVYLNFFAAFMTLIALVAVFFMYKSTQTQGQGKSFREIFQALGKVCTNGRLIALTLIISGFWLVQSQMYASMPKYVIRMVGESASPGWYANVNPFVVFLCVNFITSLMKNRRAITSMTIGMFIIPLSALVMSTGNYIGTEPILGLHPVAFMMVIGIAMQALAECFISPRFLEYFSFQSPKGEEGLYLGFSHLHSFFSYLLAFPLGGWLLEKFCPDPRYFEGGQQSLEYAQATEHAHYLWFVFVGVGVVSAIALIIYNKVTTDKT